MAVRWLWVCVHVYFCVIANWLWLNVESVLQRDRLRSRHGPESCRRGAHWGASHGLQRQCSGVHTQQQDGHNLRERHSWNDTASFHCQWPWHWTQPTLYVCSSMHTFSLHLGVGFPYLTRFLLLVSSYFFVSVPCASWPCHQLLSACKCIVSYRILLYLQSYSFYCLTALWLIFLCWPSCWLLYVRFPGEPGFLVHFTGEFGLRGSFSRWTWLTWFVFQVNLACLVRFPGEPGFLVHFTGEPGLPGSFSRWTWLTWFRCPLVFPTLTPKVNFWGYVAKLMFYLSPAISVRTLKELIELASAISLASS